MKKKIDHLSRKHKIKEILVSLKSQKLKPNVNPYIEDLPNLKIYTKTSQETGSSKSNLEVNKTPLQEVLGSPGLITSTKINKTTNLSASHPTPSPKSAIIPLQDESGNARNEVGPDINKIARPTANHSTPT